MQEQQFILYSTWPMLVGTVLHIPHDEGGFMLWRVTAVEKMHSLELGQDYVWRISGICLSNDASMSTAPLASRDVGRAEVRHVIEARPYGAWVNPDGFKASRHVFLPKTDTVRGTIGVLRELADFLERHQDHLTVEDIILERAGGQSTYAARIYEYAGK